jgi:hypothetical protein
MIYGDERKRTADDVSLGISDVKTEGDGLSQDQAGQYLFMGQSASGIKAA